MKLKQILKFHDQYKSVNALPDNLGDAYLLKTNTIYRNIRHEVIQLGYRYTSKRFRDFDALALTQLPKILKEKTIPYCDNVHCLREIEQKAKGAFNWDDVPPLRANYILHEAAHGVAHEHRKKTIKLVKTKSKLDRERAFVLGELFEESFANACESLANLDATTEIDDEFLYKNLYIMEKKLERKRLNSCARIFGLPLTFRLVMIAFLYSNFLKTNTAVENFDRVLAIVFKHDQARIKTLNKADLQLLKSSFETGFDLDLAFTIFTNRFCFRLMGLKTDPYDLLGFDFLKQLEENRPYSDLLFTLSELVSK